MYTGTYSGTATIPAIKADGSDYTFYVYIDKNPKAYKDYIVLYKDNSQVSGLSQYIGTATRSALTFDPSGQSYVWAVPITIPRSSNILEPGHHYEFAFLRGLQANNGVTCVIDSANTGYLAAPMTSDEQKQYDAHKNDEYYYRQYAQIYDLSSPVDSPSYISTNSEGKFYSMRYSFDTDKDSASPNIVLTDTVNHWAKDSINYLVGKGIINGVGNNQFAPNNNITRAEFVKILSGSQDGIDVTAAKSAPFEDVAAGKWYSQSINWAVENGIAKGYSNGKFGLNDCITREQMAVMIYNFSKVIGYDLPDTKASIVFSDDAKISSYAREAVNAMQKAGLINGKSNNQFDPQGKATRAEAAKIISILIIGMD